LSHSYISLSQIGAARFWKGAPAATANLAEAIVCGAKIIFEVGLSRGLQDFLKPGDLVVVTEANCDEGTSSHYLEPGVRVEVSPRLRDGLICIMKGETARHFVGPVWSTDAVYRETRGKFRKFKNSGVLAVDMETPAIFALAKYRNVEAASAQVISSVLTETGWLQAWWHQSVTSSTELVVRCVLKAMGSTSK
jgi:uridine phosphorylase